MSMGLGQFGDRQLEATGEFLLDRLVATSHQGISVRKVGGDRNNEIKLRRFPHNPSVTQEEMMETALARTCALVVNRHVLAIQSLPPDLIRGIPARCATTAGRRATICMR
jgi:hypothetical protein